MEKTTSIAIFILVIALIIGGVYYLPKFFDSYKNSDNYTDVDEIAENILESINSGSYDDFSRDFSQTTKEAMPKARFDSVRGLILSASGRYIKKASATKTMNNGYEVYIYDTEFEKEHVTFTLSFKPGIYKLEGLWFTSPNLTGKE